MKTWNGISIHEQAPRNATCAFCGAPAPYRCFWPCRRWADVKVMDLEVDDLVMCRKKMGRVFDVEQATLHVVVDETKARARVYHFSRFLKYPVATIRMVPCSAPVCERHVQERAEDRHICMGHWQAWEKAA